MAGSAPTCTGIGPEEGREGPQIKHRALEALAPALVDLTQQLHQQPPLPDRRRRRRRAVRAAGAVRVHDVAGDLQEALLERTGHHAAAEQRRQPAHGGVARRVAAVRDPEHRQVRRRIADRNRPGALRAEEAQHRQQARTLVHGPRRDRAVAVGLVDGQVGGARLCQDPVQQGRGQGNGVVLAVSVRLDGEAIKVVREDPRYPLERLADPFQLGQ